MSIKKQKTKQDLKEYCHPMSKSDLNYQMNFFNTILLQEFY